MKHTIRKAVADDIIHLPLIELEASKLFINYGLDPRIFATATSIPELRKAHKNGRLWIAESAG